MPPLLFHAATQAMLSSVRAAEAALALEGAQRDTTSPVRQALGALDQAEVSLRAARRALLEHGRKARPDS